MSERLFSVPFTDENFIGREAELARLDELFTAHSTVALTGIGGVGKTRLAVHYAHQQKHRYPFILWVSASTKTILADSFAAIADKLNTDCLLKQAQKIAFVKAWLEKNSGWLLIFDNADSADEITHEDLQALLPTAPLGKILFTTQLTTKMFTENRLPISCLDKQAGARFLWQCIDAYKHPTPQEISEAEAISNQLAGLPLALKQAAAYIETTQRTLPEYLQLYQQHAKKLLNPDLNKHKRSIPDHELPVFATFELSFSRLSPESQELLAFCAMLHADSIPEEILTTAFALDDYDLAERLEPIFSYGLMARNSTDKTLSLHRLIQQVSQLASDNEQKQTRAEQAITALNTLLPDVEFKNWLLCERLLFCVLECFDWVKFYKIESESAARMLNQIAIYLQNSKTDYQQAKALYERSFEIGLALVKSQIIAISLTNLAELYRIQGDYQKAEPLSQISLIISETTLGKDHYQVVISSSNLAAIYEAQGKYLEAEPLYERSLAINEKVFGKEHLNVAIDLNNLATLYHVQCKYIEAETLYIRSLNIWETVLGKYDPNVATSLNNLAALYDTQGKRCKAELLYLLSLTIREKTLDKNHPDIAQSLSNLAVFYQAQGKTSEAEPLYLRSLTILEKSLGKEHPNTKTARNNLQVLREINKRAFFSGLFH